MKHLLLISLFVFSTLSCWTNQKIANPFLWKATKGSQTIYLFGTIHRGVSINDLPSQFFTYLDSSKIFILESLGDVKKHNNSLDHQLKNRATQKSIKIVALETTADTDLLMKKVKKFYSTKKEKLEDLKYKAIDGENYKASNVKYFIDSISQTPKIIFNLFTEKRHDKWMPTILANIKKGQQLFIAVGLMHLIAKRGGTLLDRFKKKGFTIEKVKFTSNPPTTIM